MPLLSALPMTAATGDALWTRGGALLLSGGMGGIGLWLARFLSDNWDTPLIILGRSALPPEPQWEALAAGAGKAAALARAGLALRQAGVRYAYRAVDVCDLQASDAAVRQVLADWGVGLSGVLHLAGVAGDAMVADLTADALRSVMAPKLEGAANLLRILAQRRDRAAPARFVSFGSVNGWTGGVATAAYSAACSGLEAWHAGLGQLDGIVHHYLGWSSWEDTGMSEGTLSRAMLERRALVSLAPVQALASMMSLLQQGAGAALVGIDLQRPALAHQAEPGGHGPAGAAGVELVLDPAMPAATAESALRGLTMADAFGTPIAWRLARPGTAGAAGGDPALNATEQRLAAIWRALLKCGQLGADDDFFALGGHSLLATQVVSQVRQQFGVELAAKALFECSTVRQLAALIDARLGQAQAPARAAIVRVARDGAGVRASFAQQRLWFLDQLQPGDPFYNIPAAVTLDGALDAAALRLSLNEIVRRHEALRTCFVQRDDAVLQVIAPQLEVAMPLQDLAPLAPAARDAALAQQVREEADRPFALGTGPLIRARLLRMDAQRHVLLLTLHHIVADGWSMGVLVREFAALYGAFARRQPSPLADLPLQYADFAHWQRAWMQGEALGAQLEYWRGQLAGAPTLLALPTDRPRPPVQRFQGATLHFAVPAATTAGLYALSRQHQATLFMSLAAAFSLMLARYAGQQDICVGTPIANRTRAETEALVGFFVNTLVLRTRIDPQACFGDLLQQVRATALAAYGHQDVPFEQLVEALKPERHASHAPLFQVMLALQNTPASRLELPGLTLAAEATNTAIAKFDLTLNVVEGDDRLLASFEYNTDLFDAATVQRMAGDLTRLLAAVVAAPAAPLHALDMLGADQRVALLDGRNQTAAAWPDATLAQLFEAQAARTPDAVALRHAEEQLSYSELNRRANLWAHRLRAEGVGPEVLVALCAERSAEMVVGLLAILKAGGAYVPLDPAYPADRLAYMLEDARPAVLLTQRPLLASLPARDLAVLCLDQPDADGPCHDPVAGTLPDSLAYVIYTSGSTGKPKGIGVRQAGLVNFLHTMLQRPGLHAGDVLLSVTSLSFDIAALELFLPLVAGASLVLASRAAAADPQQLAALLEGQGVSVMQATPATWRMLVQHGWPRLTRPLKVLCGGEALPAELAGQMLRHVPRIWNMYGPTETTIWSALHAVEGDGVPALGRPIANTRIYLLDADLNPVPQGAAGELYIAGQGLARGYLRRPDLTAAAFIADPFSSTPGARMYRSGDLARYLADGTLDYLGRIDHQVKLRGFRIELGEIEAALHSHPGVGQAVVLAREDQAGERRLVAYLVPEPEHGGGALSFSLFYFGADSYAQDNKYALYLQSAQFADRHGFEAVWTPERHFHEVGSLYPNPSILSAALATTTTRLHLRAGSVVLPLHHPARVAEEWAVVDNLAQGRTGIAVAAGWHPRDFVLFPQNYAERKQAMLDGMHTLQALWRGETLMLPDGLGQQSAVRTFPRPLQAELPIWVTAAGNPDTFALAGQQGAHVLTHLLGQTVEQLAEQIALYRAALVRAGHDPATRRVTLMIHTYVGDALDATLERAREPFLRYMRSHLGLLKSVAATLGIDDAEATPENLEQVVSFAFKRYTQSAALIGTPESCLPVLQRLEECGVDEVACLIDWMDSQDALDALPALQRLTVAARSAVPGARTLRAHLRTQLPDYMVPSVFMPLASLPLTPNGKIDRKALPLPDMAPAAIGYVAPRNDDEAQTAQLLAGVLGLERVGMADNFFALGGHSLLATQVMSKIRARFQVELPLRALFDAATVEALAAQIALARRGADAPLRPAIGARPRDAAPVLSFAQQRMWFLDQFDAGGAAYNMPVAVRLSGQLDVAALRRSLNEVVRRQQSLRARFVSVDGQPQALIDAALALELAVTDLAALPHAEREAKAAWLAQDEAQTPFDLAAGPLIRAGLLRLGEREHIAVLTLHHIVADGWSMGVLVREVAALYGAYVQQQPSPLPELTLHYADFAHWQRQWMQGEVLAAQLDYWRGQLAGAPTLLALPTDRARPPVQRFQGAALPFTVPAATTAALHALGRRHQATLFMSLAAAFNLMLARYSGQRDICLGTPIANRTLVETEALIGCFVNTLVLRTRIDPQASFVALLEQVRATALAAYAHQDMPFEQLVEALKPERQTSHAPLFQVMLALQNTPAGKMELPGLTLQVEGGAAAIANVDLILNVIEDGGQLHATLDYNAALFDAATVARMAEHFSRLLEAIVAAPAAPLHTLDMLGQRERAELLLDWNATAADYPRATLAELFEAQAARTPAAVALQYEGEQLSYSELNRRANLWAHRLRALGVGPEVLVALCAERSAEMVVGLLAILKAGGAYVPLDPAYPAQRLAYMLEDARPAVLLTQQHLQAGLPAPAMPVLCLDGAWSGAAGPADPQRNLACAVGPDNLAYVIYTSGSTGLPKGAAVRHGGLSNFLHSMRAQPGLDGRDVLLSVTSISFDIAALELFLPLVVGARTIVAGREAAADAGQLAALIEGQGVTAMQATPTTWRLLSEGAWPRTARPLKVLCGGEALPAALAGRLLQRVPALWNLYGPTETTIWSAVRRVTAEAPTVSIGGPIGNTQLYILDAELNPAPVGVAGELHIGGAGLARGYLNRPHLTAEKFIADPYGAPGARLYRSGDLARYLADGSIEYLGRIDDQVKLRGFRIELGEIEAALAGVPAVAAAVVLARDDLGDAGGERRLVAYLQPHAGQALPADAALRAALLQSLPDYMVPAHFMALDQLPLTPNGKLDRKALPAPALLRGASGYVAPRDADQTTLAALLAAALGLDRVGMEDNFFALGGHSLLAAQVVASIRAAFQVELPLRALFDAADVAALAAQVAALRHDGGARALPAIAAQPGDAVPALSFAQQRLWFLDQLEPGSAAYNMPVAVRLSGALDLQALQRTLDDIVRRHAALRSRFTTLDGQPQLRIAPALALPLAVTDLSALPQAERQAKADWLVQDEAQTPFDLARGPLIRAGLLRLSDAEHIVMLTVHHIVSDGWSMGVLVREVGALYGAHARQLPSPLAPLPVQYADYAHWQRQHLSGAALAPQLAYWQRQLDGSPALLALPTDRPRPALQRHQGGALPFALTPALSAGLHGLARQQQATLFMTLAAAFNVLLARYSGQDDICLGTPIANRGQAGTGDLIGFFANTLVLRSRVDQDAAFTDLLRQVRGTALGAYAHQDAPFEQLVELLKPQRQTSHAPLFQVMLVLQNAPMGALALPGLTLETLAGAAVGAKYDLTLNLYEDGRQLQANFEYDADLFDAATVARMADNFVRLLEAIVAAPAAPLHTLDMLGGAERAQLLSGWNATATDYPSGGTLPQLFEAQAARTPEACALVFEQRQLSYGELNRLADRWACTLRAEGVGPDVLVGLCVERAPEMVIGMLAVLKAGGAYVPLDPAYPAERLAYMLADARAAVLLTQQHLLAALPAAGLPVFCLDGPAPALPAGAEAGPAAGALPAHLAYVIYTSGSTGRPKGVGIDHAGIVNRLRWMQDAYGLGAQDRVLQKTPFGFDVSVWEFFWPLLNGATLVLARPGGHQDAAYLAALIAQQGITTMHFVPPMLATFLSGLDPAACGTVRQVMCSGQALPLALQQQFFAALPGVALHNLYGPTEASVDVTWWACRDDAAAGCVPIGRPIANTQIYLLDAALNPVPVGVAGELHIGGVGLARGYLHRPDLTAEKFIAHPYGAPGARLYRSGDLARYLADGSIEYLGRIDDQVKLRGFRIELGEIEAALAGVPAVAAAVVLARDDLGDAGGERRLVAYLQPHAGQALPADAALRAALLQSLPDYMVPAHFMALDQLPLTPNGKLDRKALPAPALLRGASGYVAPRDADQTTLAALLAAALGLDRVGMEDNFFALGGHSLLAAQVVASIRAAFQVELPLRALFDAADVAALAAQVAALRHDGGARALPAIAAQPGDAAPALSFAQQRLWFLDQLEPGSAAYNMPVAVRLSGALDLQALQRTLDDIVRRHAALRSRFTTLDGQPQLRIAPALALPLPVTDLSALPQAERQAKADWLVQDEAQTPFDLARGPLIRAGLLRLSDAEHIVMLTVHHIVSDGWSMGVLVREVGALYGAHARQLPSPLAPLPVQYADYAHWQRQHLSGAALAPQLAYWQRQLGGSPALLALPTDRPRPALQRHQGGALPFALTPALSAGLHGLARQQQATLFMTLAAAFNVLLARYSGQDDICLGTPIANRGQAGTGDLIGFFANTLVLRSRVDQDAAFTDLLRQVRGTALGAYAHQDAPFEQLVELLKPQRQTSHAPLFQVMLVLQNAPMGALALPGLTLETLAGAAVGAKYDLTLNLYEDGRQLQANFEYDADLFDAATVARMADNFVRLLEAIVADPSVPAGRLALLGQAERRQLVEQWNDTGIGAPPAPTIHALFEAQAARTPQQVALRHLGGALSYAELDARAGRIARGLRARGVGAGALVGVCMERTPDLVAALLGVLKAGAAYVPLDPDYPRERLGFMLRDAGAALVLAHARWRELMAGSEVACWYLDGAEAGPEDAAQDGPEDGVEDCTEDGSVAAPAGAGAATDLAYVIYTSGSTGQPKGVAIEHRNAVAMLDWARATFTAAQRQGMLASTSVCFDLSVFELFVPLSWGGCVILTENALHLAGLPDLAHVSFVNTVPSAMAELVRLGQVPGSVQVVGLAGEPLQQALVQSIYQAGVGQVFNLYGPSECTTYSTFAPMPRGAGGPVSIGRPIAGTTLYILDREGGVLPLGVEGELYIGGAGVARGYLHRPELTAQKFVADPFSADPAARLYRTGDLARYRADGQVDFLGRLDHQVKLRGYRIELGEIEAALLAHEAVREALVLARADGAAGARLVAYLVGEAVPAAAALRSHLLRTLPAYMVPSAFVALAAMPLTPNGKIDRKALPAPDMQAGAGYAAAVTPTERALAALWQELLGLERVGLDDNFFDLGGHSLLAVQVLGRLRAQFAAEVPLQLLFERPTLREFAAQIEQLGEPGAPVASAAPITAAGAASAARPAPLSYAQQGVWVMQQFDPASAAYHIPVALRIAGKLDCAVLQQALNGLLERHEVLRSRFVLLDGEPVQQTGPVAPAELRVISMSDAMPADALAGDAGKAAVAALLEAQAARPFDLAGGPLLRASVLQCGADEQVLLLTAHHIAFDGWSIQVLMRELGALYLACREGRAAALPPLPLQYADYARWQRSWLQGEAWERQLRYWRHQLRDMAPVQVLPADRARPPVRSTSGGAVRRPIAPATQAALQRLGRGEGATMYMVLLAAYATLLSRAGGGQDIVIGSPVANRGRPELEPLIGFFVNSLVMRVELDGDPAFAELVRRVRRVALEAYAHQDVPFDKLVDLLQPERALSHTPLFQVWFNYQVNLEAPLSLPGMGLTQLHLDETAAKFDLALTITETPAGMQAVLTYSSDLFEAHTAQRLMTQFHTLLEDIAAAPATTVSQLGRAMQAATAQMEAEANAAFQSADRQFLRGLRGKRAAQPGTEQS